MEATFAELLKKHNISIYTKYLIRMETANKLLGGWPKDPAIELAMLEARFKKGLVKGDTVEKAREAVQEASSDDHEEETEKANLKSSTGFRSDDHGIYIESRQLKAGFKEAASTLGLTVSHRGVRQILQHSFFVRGVENADRVYLYRNGNDLKKQEGRLDEADGFEQLIAHVIGPQGPRSTIKFHEFVEPGTCFEFEIWFADPKDNRMNEKFLAFCLELAQDNGFGCSRSQGFGRVKVLTVEQLQEGSLPKSPTRTKADEKKKTKAEEKKAKAA